MKENFSKKEFIITDHCAWEANKKNNTFHPHSIEVVDVKTGQLRYIKSGSVIKIINGEITSARSQEEYNKLNKK